MKYLDKYRNWVFKDKANDLRKYDNCKAYDMSVLFISYAFLMFSLLLFASSFDWIFIPAIQKAIKHFCVIFE